MASIAYDVALILLQARTPADEIFGNDRLESENTKLKNLLADAMLDNAALKDLLAKKW